jgi:hypothetical protein
MRRRTFVFIVCSPQTRTGVSTTARLLTDFYLSQRAAVEGFDTDPREPRYGELFPDVVRIVDPTEIKGQVSLFDRLLVHDEIPKVVDVWHRGYDRFFATVKEIGFVEEARRHAIEPVVLFHVEPTEATLARALELSAAWNELTMVAVQNKGAALLGARPHEVLARYPATSKLVIAPLHGPLAKLLHEPDLSLSGFLRAPPSDMSIVARDALRAWITPIFTQFRSFELRMDLERAEFLM